MTRIHTCPVADELERLALGQLSEAAAEQLGAHILDCSTCAVALDSLQTAYPFEADLRAVGQYLPAVSGADALVERLVRARPVNADASSAVLSETPGPSSDDEPLPERLGRYQIVGRLGAGGMGVVYRAHDPHLSRDVAVKLPNFRGSGESGAAARQRFLREARAAAAVRHAHVCPIYDVGEEQGRPYVVMALVEGETLGDRLRREGRFANPRDAVALVLQVTDALAAVHAAGIVHRDLKPGNILLDRAGQPFLTDFGLARAADSERLTLVGQLLGTPAYMAPEQASPDLGVVGPGSDQYSLGVVLYQMLTGRLPFEGSVPSLLFQLGSRPVPPPSQHRPDLDPKLVSVLLKALARQPLDRYVSIGELASALRAWHDRSLATTVHPTRAAQRRRLTLLSCGCDIFESQAILEALDPEEQHDLLLDFQQLCRDVAVPLAGTVVKPTDRGLLICFGIPFALECAARRAVRAGLNLLDRLATLNERLGQKHAGLRLSVRIAIHSDLAVVTEGSNRGETLTIVGQVAPVVDQLERLAEPDTVVVSEDTYRLLHGFVECSSLGTHTLKGAAGATPIYRVHREAKEFLECSSLIPLIGRDREVALLQERWEQAALGMGQVVLLVGEAGIGKSRQVRVLKEHVAEQRTAGHAALIIEWPCSPLTQNSSLFHANRCFERLLDFDPHDSASQRVDKLAAHLEQLHLASAEAITLLGSLLSIPLEGRYPPLGLSPQRQKEKTFDLLLDWLRALAARQPVLFLIEDLHWAGPTTLEFLDLLVGQAQDARLLTLLTYRPDFVPSWKARGHHTQVSLNRLSRRQTGELVLLKSGLPTIPQDVLDQVVERTDGVPLFVEEVTAMLLEAGGLRVVNGETELSDSYELHVIPATLQDLLMARLDRLASDLDVVQLAAAIGREFSYELLSKVTSCSAEALRQELAKLVDAELLFQQGRLPQARYQFKHALIRDAAYQSLLKTKRQQFHVRIAEALEQGFPEAAAAQPELLAHHFTEGNVVLKAVTNWERAGQRAQQRAAGEEAVGHFTRGLELVQSLPETIERQSQEIRLHIGLGVALESTTTSGAPEVEATFARAQSLCLQSGLMNQAFPALYGRLRHAMDQGKNARAQQLAEEMLSLAERAANPAFALAARSGLGAALVMHGKHAEALPHLESVVRTEATTELRAILHPHVLVDPWVASHSFLSLALLLLGYPDRSAEHTQQSLTTAEGLGPPFSLGFALCSASFRRQFVQDREGTRATAARAMALGVEKHFPGIVATARILGGYALAESDQHEETVRIIRQGLEELRALFAVSDCTDFLTLLAEACARAGRLDEGLQVLSDAKEFLNVTEEYFWEAEVYRLKGELLLERNPTATEEADACFHQALAISRQQQARSLELRAAMSLARLWRQQGRTQAAGELLAPVYAGFTEGFNTHDLQAAKALLEQCRSTPS